jgi:hypothetical protein
MLFFFKFQIDNIICFIAILHYLGYITSVYLAFFRAFSTDMTGNCNPYTF